MCSSSPCLWKIPSCLCLALSSVLKPHEGSSLDRLQKMRLFKSEDVYLVVFFVLFFGWGGSSFGINNTFLIFHLYQPRGISKLIQC